MDRTKRETVLDVKWAALNQPGGENKSCTEAVLGVASLWTLRNCCCRQFEAVHFFLRSDPKSNAKATRPGAKPVCGLGTKLCSPLAVRIAVVLPEYTGATLFSKCGNKIFALWKIQLKFTLIFNRLMIQSPIHACTWAVRVLRFLNNRHHTSGCAHHNSAKTTWANTVTRTHRPNKCLVMPMWKGILLQIHAGSCTTTFKRPSDRLEILYMTKTQWQQSNKKNWFGKTSCFYKCLNIKSLVVLLLMLHNALFEHICRTTARGGKSMCMSCC